MTILLLLTVLLSATSVCAESTTKTDKLKSAALKTATLILGKLVPGVDDMLTKIYDIWKNLKDAFGHTVTDELMQKGLLDKTGMPLEAFVQSNAEIVNATTFVLHASESDDASAIIRLSLPDDKNGPLHNVLIEADVTINKLVDAKENNGFQTIAIGARGHSVFPAWGGYSFQLLSGGIMKICDQAKPSKRACNQEPIEKMKAGNKYHMLFAINGNTAIIGYSAEFRRAFRFISGHRSDSIRAPSYGMTER